MVMVMVMMKWLLLLQVYLFVQNVHHSRLPLKEPEDSIEMNIHHSFDKKEKWCKDGVCEYTVDAFVVDVSITDISLYLNLMYLCIYSE